MLHYISFRFIQGHAYTSVKSAVSALAFIQNYIGAPDITKSFLVSKALAGFQKLKPKTDVRSPVTPYILDTLIRTVSCAVYDDLFRAMYALAFHGFLRIGVFTSSHCDQNSNLLLLENLEII